MVGGIYAYFLGQIFPQFAFDPLFDLSIALMAFIGGLGTLVIVVIGLFMGVDPQRLNQLLNNPQAAQNQPDLHIGPGGGDREVGKAKHRQGDQGAAHHREQAWPCRVIQLPGDGDAHCHC